MKIIFLTILFAVVSAMPTDQTDDKYVKLESAPAPVYKTPAPAPAPAPATATASAYKAPAPAPAPASTGYVAPVKEVYVPQPYSFSYNVVDDETYNDFDHSEKTDGKVTTGSYRVELPDGRTQIVTYRADENGYRANVKYEGVAQYPEYVETKKY